jgi:hypothetical protein
MKSLNLLTLALLPIITPGKGVAYRYGPLGHLHVSKQLWKILLKPGDIAVDATCGNGHDACYLSGLCLQDGIGTLHCIDIQKIAIEATKKRLTEHFTSTHHSSAQAEQLLSQVHFHQQSHEIFPACIQANSVSLLVYNLGYLPGFTTDKALHTSTASTLHSIQAGLPLLKQGGMLSVTAYPGKAEGAQEASSVQSLLSRLSMDDWRVHSHVPLNRPLAPILFAAFKIDKTGTGTGGGGQDEEARVVSHYHFPLCTKR